MSELTQTTGKEGEFKVIGEELLKNYTPMLRRWKRKLKKQKKKV